MKCLLILAILLTACGGQLPQLAPTPEMAARGGQPTFCPDCMYFDAPGFYFQWWREDERCSGLTGRFDQIKFAVAPKPFLRLPDDPLYYRGMFFGNLGVVVFGHFWEADSVTVHHELLHALIFQNGERPDSGGHPASEFDDKCRALVWKADEKR